MATMTNATSAWTVDCGDCGQTYDQTGGNPGGNGPTICGACGSRQIRVVQHITVFDRRERAARVTQEENEVATRDLTGVCPECENDPAAVCRLCGREA